MKWAFFALLLVGGCGSDGLPVNGNPMGPGPDNSPGPNNSMTPVDLAGQSTAPNPTGPGPTGIVDLAGSRDMGPTSGLDLSQPMGAVGAPCKTACDCQTGLGCLNNACYASNLGKLYCCSSSICPSGSFCQTNTGNYGMCGGMGGGPFPGGPDLAGAPRDAGMGAGYCQYIPCMSDSRCTQLGCGSCNPMTSRCQ
jgi:hypothetical protein